MADETETRPLSASRGSRNPASDEQSPNIELSSFSNPGVDAEDGDRRKPSATRPSEAGLMGGGRSGSAATRSSSTSSMVGNSQSSLRNRRTSLGRQMDESDHQHHDTGLEVEHNWRKDHANKAHHKLDDVEQKLMASYESLDYDVVRSDLYEHTQLLTSDAERTSEWRNNWLIFGLIGITTGTVAFGMDTAIKNMMKWKWSLVLPYVERGDLTSGYFVYIGLSLALGLVATLMVCYGEPVAAGSGIPEVKGYLNGTNYLRFLRAKTGIIKAIGVCFSVTSGLIIGKEGPLIHIGSVCGANFATMPGCTHKNMPGHGKKWPYRFRTDKMKRDFVSGGAAAGVAAAFGAPTGGICFALEEAASFWSLSLTWRTYMATMLSTSTLWLLIVARDHLDSYDALGPTYGFWDDQRKFAVWELPFFVLISVFGGFAGAAFCQANFYLSNWRRKHTQGRPLRKVAEVLFCVWITATIGFWMPTWVGKCDVIQPNYRCTNLGNKYASCIRDGFVQPFRKYPNATEAAKNTDYATLYSMEEVCLDRDVATNVATKNGSVLVSQVTGTNYTYQQYSDASGKTTMPRPSCCYDYTCADNSHYNAYTCCKPPTYRYPVRDGNANAASLEHRCPYYQQTATLSFQFTEDVIKGFFHNQSDYGKIPLLVYFLCTFFVACITYGIAVPSGLFVPCILMGSAFGRLWGEYMRDWFGPSIRPDVYALIGAAAMLSSVTRITITITVILFETTGQLFMIMPIMGTVLLSKWIADHFNISLYDMHVELKCVPFVEPDPPKVMVGMLAGEVMTTPCVAMHEVESVATVIELLKTTTHNGFAVLANDGEHPFRGMVSRNYLIRLLERRAFCDGLASAEATRKRPLEERGLLPLSDFASTLQSKNMSLDPVLALEEERLPAATVLDVRAYMNPATITVSPKCPISRCYTLFRGMGIRHLPVVDDSNKPLGMITRKELMTDFAQDLY